MGHAFAELELSNPRRIDLAPINVVALADTGAVTLCIPEHVAVQLTLERESTRPVRLADGRVVEIDYVGPIKVRFGQRTCFVGAFVMGESVLLGAVPMEDMDLVVDTRAQRVTVNPAHPDAPMGRA